MVLTMLAWGGLMEDRRWATPVELARLALGAATAAAWLGATHTAAAALCVALAFILVVWFLKARSPASAAAATT